MGLFRIKDAEMKLKKGDRDLGRKVNRADPFVKDYFATNVIRKAGEKQGSIDLAFMGFNKKQIKQAKKNADRGLFL